METKIRMTTSDYEMICEQVQKVKAMSFHVSNNAAERQLISAPFSNSLTVHQFLSASHSRKVIFHEARDTSHLRYFNIREDYSKLGNIYI